MNSSVVPTTATKSGAGDLVDAGQCWELAWDRGRADISAVGASLHNLVFTLDDGSSVQPLAEAPWRGDPSIAADPAIPAHLRLLGGEWPCVPFGTTETDPCHHGFGADNPWQVVERTSEMVMLGIDYPEGHPIARLERRITGVRDAASIELELSVLARRDCHLPVGHHPIFRLPQAGHRMHLDPGGFGAGHTFPRTFEKEVSRLAINGRFASLRGVPLAAGGTADLSRPPAGLREEILLLMDVAGDVRLSYPDDGHAVHFGWNASDLPSLVIWLSDCGRSSAPWRKRFRGIGIEPVAAFFDNTALLASAPRTCVSGVDFSVGKRWTTRYRISVASLPQDQGRRK